MLLLLSTLGVASATDCRAMLELYALLKARDAAPVDFDLDTCTTGGRPPPQPTQRFTALAASLAAQGRRLVARPAPSYDDENCMDFVSTVARNAGVEMAYRRVRNLRATAERIGAMHGATPRVGDLVFFDQTYDSNRNGRWDDRNTHIAVVVAEHPDGTLEMVHRTPTKREIIYMHPRLRDTHRQDGKVLNTWMRRKRSSDPRDAKYLAGQMWSGTARLRPGQDWTRKR